MTTLYELLGALPQDDAQSLRTAFRNAVKGAHPDIRPGDPDAALKFRQIVNASEILSDDEQRAVYDHLLELARLEQKSAAKAATANRIHKLVSGLIGFAGVSAATAGGYLLFMHMSLAAVDTTAHNVYVAMRALPEFASVHLTGVPNSAEGTSPVGGESTKFSMEASAPGGAGPESHAEINPEVNADAAPSSATSEARSLLARKMIAYKNGDPTGSIVELDQAEQPNPDLLPAYVDRDAIFYRERKLERAFADVGEPKRIEKTSHSKSATAARKSRFHRTAIAAPMRRLFVRRTAAQARPQEAALAAPGY